MLTINKRLKTILLSIPLLLLVPFIAMQFTNEVNWAIGDFLVMGVLLLITGLAGEFVWRKIENAKHRTVVVIGILVLFLLIWVELAVGIFGTPFAGS